MFFTEIVLSCITKIIIMKKIFLSLVWLLSLSIAIQAQPQTPVYNFSPGVNWENHSWLYFGSTGNYIPQKSYQEDWWYDHCSGYQTPPNSGTFYGYIAAGYSHLQEQYDETTLPHYNPTYGQGCTIDQYPTIFTASNQNCGEWEVPHLPDEGPTVATFGLIDPNGKTVWNKFTNFNGYYNRIKQLKNGNFLAVGTSNSTRQTMAAPFNGAPLYYNPHTGSPNDYFIYGNVFGSNSGQISSQKNVNHIDIVEFDVNGNIIFNYIYGSYDFTGQSVSGGTNGVVLSGNSLAYEGGGEAFDFTEDPAGNIIVVGNAEDYSLNQPNQYDRAFILKLDANGFVLNKGFLVNPNPPFIIGAGAVNHTSISRAIELITISGQLNYAVSFQDLDPSGQASVYVEFLNQNLTKANTFYISSTNLNAFQQFIATTGNVNCWDLALNSSNEIIVPALTNCSGCLYAGDNVGELRMYRMLSNGTLANSTPPLFQNVHGFDLKARLTNLSSGGFGVVSTIKTTSWAGGCTMPTWSVTCGSGDFPGNYWNTNAYVAKMDDQGNKLWETNFDTDESFSCNFPAGDNDGNYPDAGDNVKRQECVYGVSEAPDGGIVISGNNSNNFDDFYVAKLYSDCQAIQNYDIKDPSGTINITTNTHWNSNHKVIGEVVINAGATLTIDNNAIIEFADTKLTGITTGITVNQGAHLVVNTGTLTSIQSCPNGMWDGVAAIGNRIQNQASAYQGIVFMTGNTTRPSTIANARIGLLLGYNGPADPTKGGGSFAKCTTSVFKNNNIDVQTVPYISPGNPNANNTYFNNCTFTSDQLLNDPSYTGSFLNQRRITLRHVYLNGVNGINFFNCKFLTDLTGSLGSNYTSDDRSIGIYSTDAKFIVAGPNPISATTYFQNLRYGIYTTASNPVNTYGVSYTNFTNCYSSIYQSNINNSKVIFNQFQITTPLPAVGSKGCFFNPTIASCRSYFYYLDQSQGYTHEENSYAVTASAGGQQVYGTVFNASPGSFNQTYRNTYSGVTRGTHAQAGNGGLQIKCNSYSAPVPVSSDISVSSGAIGSPQGICGTPTGPTGNIFDHSASDILVSTGVPSFVYRYFSTASDVPNTTLGYTPQNCLQLRTPAACPSNYPPINPCAGLPPGTCRIAFADSLYKVIKALDKLLIQGNIQNLITKINNITAQNINNSNAVGNVETALLNKSPYLSDRVLLTFLRHQPEFSNSMIKDVIIANSPVSNSVLNVVDSIPLTAATLAQINNAQIGTSARTLLEEQIQQLVNEKDYNLNSAISDILLSGDANAQTRVTNLLRKDSSITSKTNLIFMLINTGNFSAAQQLIDSVKILPGMNNITKVQQHSLSLAQSGKTWFEMKTDASLKQDIMGVAADSTRLGYAVARGALTMVYGTSGYEYIEEVQSSGSGSRLAKTGNTTSSVDAINTDKDFKAYPNPTTGELNINYAINDPTCNEATLLLMELGSGKVLIKKTVLCSTTQTTLDLKELPSGVFALSIQSNGTSPKTIRIVKVQ